MRVLVLAVLTLSVAACSTTPRHYTPVLAETPSADSGFTGAVERCTALVDAGVRANFGNQALGTAAVGTAAAYGTGAVAMASAGSTLLGSAAAASTAIIAMPVIGILVGVGYSRHVRARREGEIQDAMSTCLAESGYRVEGWERVRR